MDSARIRSLLVPFMKPHELSNSQLGQVAAHLDLLLKWNARVNLTSIRLPEEIIQRHFGESFFLARNVATVAALSDEKPETRNERPSSAIPQFGSSGIDLGSGAGFPGLPLKIFAPKVHLTLIESNGKKAAFLNEVVRALDLRDVEVLNARAQTLWPAANGRQPAADLVTMRAVERFEKSLALAAKFLAPKGTLALLIGSAQVERAHELLPNLNWSEPEDVPLSDNRVALIGRKNVEGLNAEC